MAGDNDLGTAHGQIIIDADTKGIDAADKKMDALKNKGEKTRAAWNKVGTGMLVAGGVVAGGLALAVKTASSFEKSLSGIKAVSGETADGMQRIRDKALQIGKDTAFSAGEAASAIEELAKAGVSTEDILNGAADATVALAAAGEVALPEAAALASNAMNQFGLSAKDMVGVTDSIAGAANASAIDVSDFGMSLAQVGAVAHLAGLDFDDTAVAIAEMGNAGIKGSDAGTSLKSMLMRLQPQTTKTADLMKELGIITKEGNNRFYDQEGRLKKLKDIQGILAGALKGMSKEQQQATLQTLFGSDAIRAAAVLAGEGAKGYQKMSDAIKKTSAADVAKTRMDNLEGSIEQLKGSLETLGIQLGTVLIPIIRQVVDAVGVLVNWFLALPDGVKQTIVVFAAAAAAFLLIGGSIIKIVGFAKGLVAAFQAIRAAWMLLNLSFAASPIGLIIIAIIALVAAIIWLWNNCETFRNIVKAVWAAIQKAIGKVVEWIKATVIPFLKKAWDVIAEGAKALWNTLTEIWDAIYGVIKFAVDAITWYIKTYIEVWKTIFTTVFNVIKTIFTTYFNIYKTVVTTVFNAIKAVVVAVWNAIKSYIANAVNAIKSVIQGIQAVVDFVRGVFQRVYDTIVERVQAVISWLSGVGQKILNALGNLGTLLVNAGKLLMQGFLNGIKAGFGPIADFVGGITSWISDHKGPKQKDLKLLVPHGKWIMGGLAKGLTTGYKDVKKNVNLIGKSVSRDMNAAVMGAAAGVAGDVTTASASDLARLAQEATLQKLLEVCSRVSPLDSTGGGGSGGGSGGRGRPFDKAGAGARAGTSGGVGRRSGTSEDDLWGPARPARVTATAAAAELARLQNMKSYAQRHFQGPRFSQHDYDQRPEFGSQVPDSTIRRGAPHGAVPPIEVKVYNPVPEKPSESIFKSQQRIFYLGLIS